MLIMMAALVVTGCGGDDAGTGTGTGTSGTGANDTTTTDGTAAPADGAATDNP
jgi:hypothetical protein